MQVSCSLCLVVTWIDVFLDLQNQGLDLELRSLHCGAAVSAESFCAELGKMKLEAEAQTPRNHARVLAKSQKFIL